MIHIALHKLWFRAFHGLYEEERVLGNEFELNLDVWFDPPVKSVVQRLDQTINYASLFALVKERMKQPEPLLETLVADIAYKAKNRFPEIAEINVSISKINMPLSNFQGKIEVSFHEHFSKPE